MAGRFGPTRSANGSVVRQITELLLAAAKDSGNGDCSNMAGLLLHMVKGQCIMRGNHMSYIRPRQATNAADRLAGKVGVAQASKGNDSED